MNSIAVVIPSCDGFRDIWEPQLECVKRFWPSCEWPVWTVSNAIPFGPPERNIQTGQDLGWCQNLLYALDKINTTHVFLLLDDLLVDSVRQPMIDRAWTIMQNDAEIVCFRVGSCSSQYHHPTDDQSIGMIHKWGDYLVSCSPAIWRTDYLRQILSRFTTPWEFEIHGTRLASTLPGIFMMYPETGMAVIFSAITRGRIERGAKRFLASHGIPYHGDREECGT